jgi:hypothetical protein
MIFIAISLFGCQKLESTPEKKSDIVSNVVANVANNDKMPEAHCDTSYKNTKFPFLLPSDYYKSVSITDKEIIKFSECDRIKLFEKNDGSKIKFSEIIKPWLNAKELIYTNKNCNDGRCEGLTITLFLKENHIFGYLQYYEGNAEAQYVPLYNLEINNNSIQFILTQDILGDENISTMTRRLLGKFKGSYSENTIQGVVQYKIMNEREDVLLKRVNQNPDPFVRSPKD